MGRGPNKNWKQIKPTDFGDDGYSKREKTPEAFKRADFRDETSFQKYLKNLSKNKEEPKINRDHEAWRRWAKVNNESQ